MSQKLYDYIYERPLIYDDNDLPKLGTIDPDTETKWGKLPSKNLTIPQITKWVEKQVKDGVLKTTTGEPGKTRQAYFNDGKTIFKYNYTTDFGNQTEFELKTFKKWYNKYNYVLPNTYAWGKNWVVQERVQPFDGNKFKRLTKISTIFKFEGYVALSMFMQTFDGILKTVPWREVKKYKNIRYEQFLEYLQDEAPKTARGYKGWMHLMFNNLSLYTLLEFCVMSNVTLEDFHVGNIGTIGERIVVMDYGLKNLDGVEYRK